MNSRWSLNRQNLFYQIFLAWKLKKFFNQNIVFNWQLPDLQNVFICFSKVNLSSLVTARSSTESLGILLIDEGAELFCKFLFVIIIFWNSWDCDLILANQSLYWTLDLQVPLAMQHLWKMQTMYCHMHSYFKEPFLLNKNKSFKKILNSKAPNMEPCGTRDNSSRTLL